MTEAMGGIERPRGRPSSRRSARLRRNLALTLASCGLVLGSGLTPAAATAASLPPIKHVWVIVLENQSFAPPTVGSGCSPFQSPGCSPYLRNVLRNQGLLLDQYWGVGHNSMDNYLAMVSGQAPNPESQADCESGRQWTPADPVTDLHGQAIGHGCFMPAKVKTLFDQLEARGLTWKAYQEDLGDDPAFDASDGPCPYRNTENSDDSHYALKHDPVQWFPSVTQDQARCKAHDVSVYPLARDLQTIQSTPNFSFISPNLYNDGHEGGFARTADSWLRQYVPMILSSPAYRQDGMVIVTFDESETLIGVPVNGRTEDSGACCNELPGPNSPDPGITGPGGGRVGALVLSPYAQAGATDPTPYNHYSFLRSMEDIFGIATGGDDGRGHLGFAGTYLDYPGPGAFGSDVFNAGRQPVAGSGAKPSGAASSPRPRNPSVAWQHPLPQGNDLQDISCPTDESCVAVGEEGTVVTTTDGGTDWTVEAPPGGTDLRGVSCPSAADCVAVGGAGAILASSDRGHVWAGRGSGTEKALNAVSCATTTVCVAVGDGGTILRTTDGGGTWSAQPAGTTQPLYGVSCATPVACMAVGLRGTIRATTDGATWSDKSLSAPVGSGNGGNVRFHSVSCASAARCVLGGDVGKILTTADGGTSWTQPPGWAQIKGARFLGTSCSDATTCFFVGEFDPMLWHGDINAGVISAITPVSAASKLQRSNTDNILNAVSCPTASTCIAVGARGTIQKTSDGGATGWSATASGANDGLSRMICTSGGQCLPEGVNRLAGVACTDSSTCYAVGGYRTVMATTDSGAHWTTQTSGAPVTVPFPQTPPLPPSGLNAISCPTRSTCYAVGDVGSLISTNDGGSHWSDRATSVTGDLLAISCPSQTVCYVTGGSGAAIKTRDGGASWQKLDTGVGNYLAGISCSSTSQCVVVGSNGLVRTTRDGGASWSPAQSGTAAYLSSVDCPKSSLCYAVGQGGTVLRSKNGGQQWSAQASSIGDDLSSVSCSGVETCVATGSMGTVLATGTGGRGWAVVGTGTKRGLLATDCPGSSRCLAVGDSAAILAVSPSGTGGRPGRP